MALGDIGMKVLDESAAHSPLYELQMFHCGAWFQVPSRVLPPDEGVEAEQPRVRLGAISALERSGLDESVIESCTGASLRATKIAASTVA